jgi:hypothetical protein
MRVSGIYCRDARFRVPGEQVLGPAGVVRDRLAVMTLAH